MFSVSTYEEQRMNNNNNKNNTNWQQASSNFTQTKKKLEIGNFFDRFQLKPVTMLSYDALDQSSVVWVHHLII